MGCHFTLKCCVCVSLGLWHVLRTGQASLSVCWDGADQQLLGWIQLEKERDGQKSPAPAYLVIVYPAGMAPERTNAVCSNKDGSRGYYTKSVSQTEKYHVIMAYKR